MNVLRLLTVVGALCLIAPDPAAARGNLLSLLGAGGKIGASAVPWTPANLSAGVLRAWYEASDLASSSVTSWTDKSGNGYTPTGTATWSATSFNTTYPGVSFNGSTNSLRGTFGTGAAAGTPTWAFAAGSLTSGAAGARVVSLSSGSDVDYAIPGYIPIYNSSSSNLRSYNSVTGDGPLVNPGFSTPYIVGELPDATTITSDLNGTLGTPTASVFPSSNAPMQVNLGSNDFGADAMTGTIATVVIGIGTLSTTDRQKLEGYLACHNGLQSLLPGGHPYKSTCPTV